MKKIVATTCILAASLYGATADSQIKALEDRLNELQSQNALIIEELGKLKEEKEITGTESFTGMGVAASKVYRSESALSVGGYGEMNYVNKTGSDPVTDLYRFIPYIGYKFSDSIIMNTELEWEHGGKESEGGYVIVEFSYLDFLLHKNANVRVGHILVPMGNVNLRHEPPLYLGVNRPDTEKYVIPSTWHHNGLLVFGEIVEGLSYQAGIIESLNANSMVGENIREGRLSARNKNANQASIVARIDYNDAAKGLNVGFSVLNGTLNHDDNATLEDAAVGITMYDLHLTYKSGGVDLKALYAKADIDDEALIGYEGSEGYYVSVGYDIMPLINAGAKAELLPFVRYEVFDEVITAADDEKTNTTVGFNYKPVSNVVIKADYMITEQSGKDDVKAVELGLGYLF